MVEIRKPRIVVSACLLGDRVRYDGGSATSELVRDLVRDFEVIKVCPEVELGLGIPREKIIVYYDEGKRKLSQPATGRELTQELVGFSESFLNSLPPVEGFILKGKSPSCGVSSRTKTYKDPSGKEYSSLGKGLFAEAVLERFPHYPVEDEIRLTETRVKEKFLLKVWLLWSLRAYPEGVNKFLKSLKLLLPRMTNKALGMLKNHSQNEKEIYLMHVSDRLPPGKIREMIMLLKES